MSNPIILVFMRELSTVNYLWEEFRRLPFKKLIKIHNVDDVNFSIKRLSSNHLRLNHETIFLVTALLLAVAFYHQAWIMSAIIALLSIIANLLFIYLERSFKNEDHLIRKYKDLVLKGETFIGIECSQADFEKFINVIQRIQDEPIAFFSFISEMKLKNEIRSKEMLPHSPESQDQLEKQAKGLATATTSVSYQKKLSKNFLKLVQDLYLNYQFSFKQLNNLASYNENIQLSAEWLLDNAYTVKQSIQDIKKNLPESYFSELPFITSGPHAGAPSLYPLAARIIAASDGRVTSENITAFLNAYQEVKSLTIGELWAFPLILKIRLIECLVNLINKVVNRVKENQSADFWANRILNATRKDPEKLYSILSALSKEMPNPTTYFADQLMIQLTDTEAANTVILGWLQRKVGENLHNIIQVEQSKQTLEQTSIANVISSLRRLEQMNWRDVFDEVSLVEKTLNRDPAEKYSEMDFTTKDSYRHAVENIAKKKKIAETEVADLTVSLGKEQSSPLTRHVGYYLLDEGKKSLEKAIHYQPSFLEKTTLLLKKHLPGIYVFVCGLLTFLIAVAFLYKIHFNFTSWTVITILFLLSLVPFSELVIQLINYISARLVKPHIMPKMDYKKGVPEAYRTLVVIPMMLSSEKTIHSELEKLEIHYLANSDPQIAFGLITDFIDHHLEEHFHDNLLLKIAKDGIQYLNTKYPEGKFYLFHRKRKLNDLENCWMGWERKRGKLENLNSFLCGSEESDLENFLHEGEASFLPAISYILTVDSDTQLPKNSVRKLIETLSHPLNIGYADPITKTLLRGYTIIQPRVSTNYLSANSTWFAKLFSDPSGIDPYSKSISDVYQDLFEEGVYHGKGLYDYKLFHRILSKRLPENKVLSHDLLEGSYVRVAFASDIEFYDSFPENYALYAKRQQRWVRGDWQLLDWLKRFIKDGGNRREKNPLSLINRWKIFDNLRRSLLPVTLTSLLLLSWATATFLPWTLLALAVIFLPVLLNLLELASIPSIIKYKNFWVGVYEGLIKTLVSFSFLPHQAWINASAIFKSLYRQFFSGRNMLQWTLSSAFSNKDVTICGVQLGLIAAVSLIAIPLFLYYSKQGLGVKIPILVLWSLSPLIFALLNKPYLRDASLKLTAASEKYLRLIARKTWRYFDDFVTLEANFLPPDNYQEKLRVEVAYRTSPTNIGLYMMSAISAHSFGYITGNSLFMRLNDTVNTLKKLERFEGHFLNWYDIKNISPLLPKYVSTVDSGNLLASFWTAEEKCRSILNEPILDAEKIVNAIEDNFSILASMVKKYATGVPFNLNHLYQSANAIRKTPTDLKTDLEELLESVKRCIIFSKNTSSYPDEILYWLQQQQKLIEDVLDTFANAAPWIRLFDRPEARQIAILHPEGLHWKGLAIKQFPTYQDLLSRNVEGLIPFIGWLQTIPEGKLDVTLNTWAKDLILQSNQAFSFAEKFKDSVEDLNQKLHAISEEMNLHFLYNSERKLFSIGFNVTDNRLDSSCYDLLASEARMSSFVAIAKGDVPLEHWWALGRPTTQAFGMVILQSWGGTMFEYLMPVIWSKNFNNTLLDYACKVAVKCQIAYGNEVGIPWGISESAYSRLDIHNIYQYRAFGVPFLGLKTGLENDFVVTPYSSALALMIDPIASTSNLKRLDNHEAMRGPYGFFEAIDYTRQYLSGGKQGIVIHAYMAHHLGMSICGICNTLNQGYIQNLFHAHPRVKSLESILYERPEVSEGKIPGRSKEQISPKIAPSSTAIRNTRFETPLTPVPVTHLLSNGNYSIMVTNSGSGYSKFKDLDISRWRVDATCDNWGSCIFIRDAGTNAYFSAASYPTSNLGSSYSVNFSNHKVDISKKDLSIEATTEIVVSPEDNVEIRCMTITNQAMRFRQIEVTSYMEIALAEHKADLMHPAFSKMFIETEAIDECEGLIARRHPRSAEDREMWCFHIAATEAESSIRFSYETRRDLFIGTNRTLADAEKLTNPLTNSHGYVLDPMFSLRKKIRVEAGKQFKISFVTGFASTKEEALQLLNKYRNIDASIRVLDMAWTHAELDLRRLHITHDDAHLFQRLANLMIYPDPLLRAPSEVLKANRYSQQQLWGYGISGDNPILIVAIEDLFNIDVVNNALMAHAFWSLRGLKTDVVIINKEKTSYEKPLNDYLVRVALAYAQYTGLNISGGIFLLDAEKIPKEDLDLIYTVAHAVLVAEKGSLSQQLALPRYLPSTPKLLKIQKDFQEEASPPLPFLELLFFNGIGGFTTDGKEYAIFYDQGKTNNAPWINVICNKKFGFLASSHGLGMTWHSNSQMNRISPWSNDATLNPISDICYIRDDQSGKFWTIACSPILENDPYRVRHGNGYTVYEHSSHAIEQEMTIFTPLENDDPIRIQILKLTNKSSYKRTLSIYHYLELTLGQEREESQRYIETSWDYETCTLTAINYYRPVFANQMAFYSCYPPAVSYTTNRKSFIGRNQTTKSPNALKRSKLSERTDLATDPCFALQNTIELYPNESTEVILVLGECENFYKVKQLVSRYNNPAGAHSALDRAKNWWDHFLTRLQVKTPDQSLDLLFNRWLTYQNLGCRMWGRSAFYQSGGAYGFRDQLQDSAALVYFDPSITKEHILKCAGKQFVEGDVQHWWHEETGSGVRTKISDDLLWLPYVVMHYIQVTGDESIMDIEVPYLEGRLLDEGEHEAIVITQQSSIKGNIKEHCFKAIERALVLGPHGLPLIGGGDWNDGMNLVGVKGQGESVWLAWFIIYILKEFSTWLHAKGEPEQAENYRTQAQGILKSIEDHAWDGAWYLRAFFDDGTPIGSHKNEEDKIDSLPQTWAVINGENNERVNSAMDSVEKYLIDEIHKLILLFTPPYDKAAENPGYIKGYPPGVRENGGQYTHAAVWVAMAFAKKGNGNKAMHLLHMINPINHSKTLEDVYKYRVEPYVTAADIYALPQQEGRGGWTWYTGSASLMYRTILEDVLGFKLRADKLVIDPCIPSEWNSFDLTYWHGEGCYEIHVENTQNVCKGVISIELDGQMIGNHHIELSSEKAKHRVNVRM